VADIWHRNSTKSGIQTTMSLKVRFVNNSINRNY